jgi:O-antigen/teichoic acid export membrane protein
MNFIMKIKLELFSWKSRSNFDIQLFDIRYSAVQKRFKNIFIRNFEFFIYRASQQSMSLIKKLAGETAVYGLSSIFGRFLNYFLVPLYTNIFPPSEYGIVTYLYAWVGLLTVFFVYRMETGFFRFGTKAADRDKAYSTLSTALLVTTPILCGLLIWFAEPIAVWMKYPEQTNYIIWFAIILGLEALSAIPFAKLRLDGRPWVFAGIKLTNIGVNLSINLFFLLLCPYLEGQGWDMSWIYNSNWGIEYIFIANLTASAITLLLLAPSYFKTRFEFDKALLKKTLIYILPLVLVGFAGLINEVIDRVLLKYLLPYSDVENEAMIGIYGACYKLAMLLSLFTQAFNYAAEPFFFRNADRKDALDIYAKVALYFTVVGALGFLGITLYIDIAQFFIGDDYRAGLVVVPILLLANLFLGIYYNFAIWYKLKDKTVIGAFIAIGGALITLVLNFWLIPIIGYVGSAWATLVCYFSMTAACYFAGRKYLPVPYQIGKMFVYIVLAIGIYGLNLWFRTVLGNGSISLFVVNTLLIVGFLGVFYRFDGKTLIEN